MDKIVGKKNIFYILLLISVGILSACGGGGGDTLAPPVTVTPPAQGKVAVRGVVFDQNNVLIKRYALVLNREGQEYITAPNLTAEVYEDRRFFNIDLEPGEYNLRIVDEFSEDLLNQSVIISENGVINGFANEQFTNSLNVVVDYMDSRHLADCSDCIPLEVLPGEPGNKWGVGGQVRSYADAVVMADFSHSDASKVELLFSGEGCGDLKNEVILSNKFERRVKAGRKGVCHVTFKAHTLEGIIEKSDSFHVEYTDYNPPNIYVPDTRLGTIDRSGLYFSDEELHAPTVSSNNLDTLELSHSRDKSWMSRFC